MIALALGQGAQPALATPVTVAQLFHFRDTRGLNDVGIGQGDRDEFGADSVISNSGTTITGVQGITVGPALCAGITANPNFCATAPVFSGTRTGSWDVTFQNGSNTTVATTPSLAGIPADPVPFAVSVAISGTGLQPTLSWTVPGGFAADAVRVNIFDKGSTLVNGQNDIIFTTALSPTLTSFQVPAGKLQDTGKYVLNLQFIETRNHVPLANNSDTLIFRRSSSFFDFSPRVGAGPPQILLPTVGPAPDPGTGLGARYQFSVVGVKAGQTIFIDPSVAVGYKYAIGTGDPKFASVLLPAVQSNSFTLSFLMGQSIFHQLLAPNTEFFFPSGGVAAFDVTGIDPAANLDPANVTAFVTGLTFVGDGDFTGSMTPIIEDLAATPEPTALVLWGTTMASLGLAGRRRHRKN
jgi:hypothetical protein